MSPDGRRTLAAFFGGLAGLPTFLLGSTLMRNGDGLGAAVTYVATVVVVLIAQRLLVELFRA